MGQLSLSIALRRIVDSGAKEMPRMTALFGYGALLRAASTTGSNTLSTASRQKRAAGPIHAPLRTTTRSRLGTTRSSSWPAPAPANASRGTFGQTQSKLTHQQRPD